MKVILSSLGLISPRHSVVRQWIHRYGCHQLEQSVEAGDWIVIADTVLDVGTMKCLAIIGVRMEDLDRKNLTLSHNDVTLLGLYPSEKLTGEHFEKALSEIEEKIGNIDAVVIDEGADLKKGAGLYREKHSNTKVLYDIKHKMALVMKRHLENNDIWESYKVNLAETRKLAYQTELAPFIPPSQRTKARYMDISDLIDWAFRVLEAKNSGRLDFIPEERYQEYFGWVKKYLESLKTWSLMAYIVGMICNEARIYGLSKGLHEYLMTFFLEASLEDKMDLFIGECLEKIMEETDKLEAEETLVCSTEVIESVFGKYKQVNNAGQGVTANVLGIGAFLSERSNESVKETMEGCSVKAACSWIEQKIGKTASGIRRRVLGKNGTKFDENEERLLLA